MVLEVGAGVHVASQSVYVIIAYRYDVTRPMTAATHAPGSSKRSKQIQDH